MLEFRSLRLAQLNRSSDARNSGKGPPRRDPSPRTSSISCSVKVRASQLSAATGRVNCIGWDEFKVICPSYGPPVARRPSAYNTGAVFNPMARPAALLVVILAVKGFVGNVEIAVASLGDLASALRAFT